MNILITGGAGFIGSNLSLYFLNAGHDVTVVDSLITGSKRNADELAQHPRCTVIIRDICSPEFINQFSDPSTLKFDRIYHLACPTGVPNIQILGKEMIDTCSIGTRNVLEIARMHSSQFLFTSSSEVYGDPLVSPQTESYTGNVDPQGWRANYEEGKRFSETLVAMYVDTYSVNARTVRFFNVYGPRMSMTDQRVIPRFLTQALRGVPLTVQGDGLQERTMCYVGDVVRALEIVMEQGDVRGIYNIGSDEKITMIEFAQKVLSLTQSQSEISHTERPAHDHFSRMPDLHKIYSLGWKRSVPLDQGLSEMIQEYKGLLSL